MSSSDGQAYLVAADGTETLLGHFKYSGTSDLAHTAIHPTHEALQSAWWDSISVSCRECTCGTLAALAIKPVRLFASYGGGFSWRSEACTRCMTITGPLSELQADPDYKPGDW